MGRTDHDATQGGSAFEYAREQLTLASTDVDDGAARSPLEPRERDIEEPRCPLPYAGVELARDRRMVRQPLPVVTTEVVRKRWLAGLQSERGFRPGMELAGSEARETAQVPGARRLRSCGRYESTGTARARHARRCRSVASPAFARDERSLSDVAAATGTHAGTLDPVVRVLESRHRCTGAAGVEYSSRRDRARRLPRDLPRPQSRVTRDTAGGYRRRAPLGFGSTKMARERPTGCSLAGGSGSF